MTLLTRGSLTGVLAAGLLLGLAARQPAAAGVIVSHAGEATLAVKVHAYAGGDLKAADAIFSSIQPEGNAGLVAPVASMNGATASVGGSSYYKWETTSRGGAILAASSVNALASGNAPYSATAIADQSLYVRSVVQFDEPTTVQVVYGINAQTAGFAAAAVNGIGANTIQNGGGRFEVYSDYLGILLDARALAAAVVEYYQGPDGLIYPSPNNEPDSHGFTGSMLTWSIGELPGLRKENPLQPNPTLAVAVWPDSPDTNQPTLTDSYVFATPVAEGYGLGADRLYFDPLLASGYRYHVDGTRFASFVVPDPLPDGDDMFELLWRGTSYALAAGQIFDFTAVDPLGAVDFDLRGLSVPHAPNATHAPFVSGITFTEAGLARVTQSALVSPIGSTVPEPTSLALAGFAGIGIAVGAWRRRRQGA